MANGQDFISRGNLQIQVINIRNNFPIQNAKVSISSKGEPERVLEQLRNSIVGNDKKRSIVVAKNYLQSFLQPYSSCIQVIDRANTSLSEVEKAIGGNSQQDVASACVFLTVIMQDLKESSQTVQVGNDGQTHELHAESCGEPARLQRQCREFLERRRQSVAPPYRSKFGRGVQPG